MHHKWIVACLLSSPHVPKCAIQQCEFLEFSDPTFLSKTILEGRRFRCCPTGPLFDTPRRLFNTCQPKFQALKPRA